jgi:hypothetical protein
MARTLNRVFAFHHDPTNQFLDTLNGGLQCGMLGFQFRVLGVRCSNGCGMPLL